VHLTDGDASQAPPGLTARGEVLFVLIALGLAGATPLGGIGEASPLAFGENRQAALAEEAAFLYGLVLFDEPAIIAGQIHQVRIGQVGEVFRPGLTRQCGIFLFHTGRLQHAKFRGRSGRPRQWNCSGIGMPASVNIQTSEFRCAACHRKFDSRLELERHEMECAEGPVKGDLTAAESTAN